MSGGVRAVAEFAAELQRRGHEVTVISAPYPPPAVADQMRSILYRRPWPGRGGKRPSHLDACKIRHIVIDSARPIAETDVPDGDVIIATWWRTAEWVGGFSDRKGIKFHLIQHYETWGGDKDRVDATWRLPLRRIVVSKWLADLARDKFNDDEAILIHYGLDHAQFTAPPRGRQKEPTVGIVYSLTKFKGCDIALRAVELASQTIRGLKLLAFGVVLPVRELPLLAGARYVLNPGQDRLREIYATCDVFLCASHAEGFYLPALEAMACRCPVVSTRVGWPMEGIVDGVNGYLAETGDAAGLAAGMVKTLTLSDEQWKQMSDAAYAAASRYTWQNAGEKIEAVMAQAMKTRSSVASAVAPTAAANPGV